jgi:hypothetical protein
MEYKIHTIGKLYPLVEGLIEGLKTPNDKANCPGCGQHYTADNKNCSDIQWPGVNQLVDMNHIEDATMQNTSKPFYIFPYIVNGVKYVEAYPIHNEGNNDMPYIESIPSYRLLTIKPSRNQARKLAYKLWVHPTGKGFNRFPHSPTSTNFHMCNS